MTQYHATLFKTEIAAIEAKTIQEAEKKIKAFIREKEKEGNTYSLHRIDEVVEDEA